MGGGEHPHNGGGHSMADLWSIYGRSMGKLWSIVWLVLSINGRSMVDLWSTQPTFPSFLEDTESEPWVALLDVADV